MQDEMEFAGIVVRQAHFENNATSLACTGRTGQPRAIGAQRDGDRIAMRGQRAAADANIGIGKHNTATAGILREMAIGADRIDTAIVIVRTPADAESTRYKGIICGRIAERIVANAGRPGRRKTIFVDDKDRHHRHVGDVGAVITLVLQPLAVPGPRDRRIAGANLTERQLIERRIARTGDNEIVRRQRTRAGRLDRADHLPVPHHFKLRSRRERCTSFELDGVGLTGLHAGDILRDRQIAGRAGHVDHARAVRRRHVQEAVRHPLEIRSAAERPAIGGRCRCSPPRFRRPGPVHEGAIGNQIGRGSRREGNVVANGDAETRIAHVGVIAIAVIGIDEATQRHRNGVFERAVVRCIGIERDRMIDLVQQLEAPRSVVIDRQLEDFASVRRTRRELVAADGDVVNQIIGRGQILTDQILLGRFDVDELEGSRAGAIGTEIDQAVERTGRSSEEHRAGARGFASARAVFVAVGGGVIERVFVHLSRDGALSDHARTVVFKPDQIGNIDGPGDGVVVAITRRHRHGENIVSQIDAFVMAVHIRMIERHEQADRQNAVAVDVQREGRFLRAVVVETTDNEIAFLEKEDGLPFGCAKAGIHAGTDEIQREYECICLMGAVCAEADIDIDDRVQALRIFRTRHMRVGAAIRNAINTGVERDKRGPLR